MTDKKIAAILHASYDVPYEKADIDEAMTSLASQDRPKPFDVDVAFARLVAEPAARALTGKAAIDDPQTRTLAAVASLAGAKECPHCKRCVSGMTKCTAPGYKGVYHVNLC